MSASVEFSIFIKRAETYITEETIINIFRTNNIGEVSSVKFIEKQQSGKKYNGVLVNFKKWNTNSVTRRILEEIATSPDGTTKFYFNSHRYWFIKVHQEFTQEIVEEGIESCDPSIFYLQLTNKSLTENNEKLLEINEASKRKIRHQEWVHENLHEQIEELNEQIAELTEEQNQKEKLIKKQQEQIYNLQVKLQQKEDIMTIKDNTLDELHLRIAQQDSMLSKFIDKNEKKIYFEI